MLGWIFFFPLLLTILPLPDKSLPSKVRHGIIAAAWIIILAVRASNASSSSTTGETLNGSPTASNLQVKGLSTSDDSPADPTEPGES